MPWYIAPLKVPPGDNAKAPVPDRGVAGDLQRKAPAQGGATTMRLSAGGSVEMRPPPFSSFFNFAVNSFFILDFSLSGTPRILTH
jgi:hypothetical protein